jgi:trehalose 6-phosphate phosphatase
MAFIRDNLVYNQPMDQEIELLIAATEALPKDQHLLLLLDYDGTLVEIAPRPELARPTQELIHVLGRLASLPGLALVVVSGRSLMNLRELLPIRGLNYLGSHGAEGLIAGESWTPKIDTGNKDEQEVLQRQLIGKLADLSGWWLETKSMGFALHYRQARPNEEERIMSVLESWLAQVDRSGRHQILRGKKVVEILPHGVSKGSAIQEILLFSGFSDHFPIYIGDDVTDESAFQVLQGRGLTIKVGVGTGATAATYLLPHPAAVRQFLALVTNRLEDLWWRESWIKQPKITSGFGKVSWCPPFACFLSHFLNTRNIRDHLSLMILLDQPESRIIEL